MSFPGGSDGNVSAYNAGNLGLIPGLRRSPEEGNGNPFHHPCLGNSMDRRAWWATVHGIAKSQHNFVLLTYLRLKTRAFNPASLSVPFQLGCYFYSNRNFSLTGWSLKAVKTPAALKKNKMLRGFFSFLLISARQVKTWFYFRDSTCVL